MLVCACFLNACRSYLISSLSYYDAYSNLRSLKQVPAHHGYLVEACCEVPESQQGVPEWLAGITKVSARGAKLGRSQSKPCQIPSGRRSGSATVAHPSCAWSGAPKRCDSECSACGGGPADSQPSRHPVWDSFSESWDVAWGRSPPRLKRPPIER